MSNFQEAVFLKYQRQYRLKHTRKVGPWSGLLVSVTVALIAINRFIADMGGIA